jgi:small subunit ribosomal protein S4
VDGRRVDIPSFLVAPGQRISIPGWQGLQPVVRTLEERRTRPAYMDFEASTCTGTLLREPARDEIPEPVNEALIVEFYSR